MYVTQNYFDHNRDLLGRVKARPGEIKSQFSCDCPSGDNLRKLVMNAYPGAGEDSHPPAGSIVIIGKRQKRSKDNQCTGYSQIQDVRFNFGPPY